ncbi:MAG: hypothetical protein RBR29_08555 [Castellaniella sp.]|uniref:hypothetical protein n=1 Tax=Castellaniella sp. TaxID=1955812 RepID=UPI002A36D436|nr:hypothetical protein [Castellaniella sp.]MDY0309825.1 hypothetical protein [Castellaniella sp.]
MNIQALHFVLDIDGNGSVAGWEIIEALKWAFSLPGRLMIEGLGNIPFVADAFHIQASAATGYASFHSLPATVLNLTFWVGCLVLITRIGAHRKTTDPAASGTETAPADVPGMPHYRGPKTRKT